MTDARAAAAELERTDELTGDPPRRRAARADASQVEAPGNAAGLIVLAALATGLLRQGAYFAPGQWAMGLIVTGALALALGARPLSRADLRLPPVPFMFGLAAWAVVVAAVRGSSPDGLPPALLAIGIVAVLVVCRRVGAAGRETMLVGIVVTALVVSVAGWLGLAFRLDAWRWEAQGLWRASSTLTYPNAMAAVLVPVALVVLALLAGRPRSLPLGLAATGLLIGAGATLSRAGLFALAAGAIVLVAALDARTVAKTAVGPFVGAAVALVALVPSMTASGAASPGLAAVGLLAGVGIGAGLAFLDPRTALGVVGATCLTGVLALVALGPARFGEAAADIADARLTLASTDRFHGAQAALGALGDHPLTGAGPGLTELRWTRADGVQATLRYAHNEYAQVAAELGLVGATLLAGGLVALAWLLWRARDATGSGALWAGVAAGLCAFAVHSGLDFIWHIPAIPLLAASLVGLVTPPPTPRSAPPSIHHQPTHRRGESR
ncbi:MAG: O-antigen ligase family protein [Acidimicrobiales bacterium]